MTEETANSEDMQDEIRELTRKFVEEEVARAQAGPRAGHTEGTGSGRGARRRPSEKFRENQRRVNRIFSCKRIPVIFRGGLPSAQHREKA